MRRLRAGEGNPRRLPEELSIKTSDGEQLALMYESDKNLTLGQRSNAMSPVKEIEGLIASITTAVERNLLVRCDDPVRVAEHVRGQRGDGAPMTVRIIGRLELLVIGNQQSIDEVPYLLEMPTTGRRLSTLF